MGTFSALLAICAGNSSPVNSPHKGQWRGALMFSLICACMNSWVNNGEAGDLRRHRAHYGVTVTLMNHRRGRQSTVTVTIFFFFSETGDTTSDQLMTIISAMVLFGSLAGVHILFCLSSTLKPRQNGRHFADDIFKCIFLNENSIGISLKFVPDGSIDNIQSLDQIMACRRPGDKPSSEPMMA